MNRILMILCLVPLPALADPPTAQLGTPMGASEFEAYSTGKTLTYAEGGQVWGQEEYLPGHQVVWAFTDQPCEFGTWTESRTADNAPQICFVYTDNPDTNCWQFFLGKGGLTAIFVGGSSTALSEVAQTNEPMQCPGPKVGV